MTQGARSRWASSPRVRRAMARVLVVVGAVIALLALVTARWGLLFVAVVVVGLGAAMGPARIRRD